VQQKSPQELIDGQCHEFVLTAIPVVFPTECDFAFCKGNQPLIGYGDAVCVMGQIFEYILGATEGRLDIDYPSMAMDGT